jgi:hypothetical protein
MWTDLTSAWQGMLSSLGWAEAFIALGFSVAFSLVVYWMYQLFYGSRHIGAGVHRMFLLGGPAITVLFLGIQTSIPLSLGLLGALSFVRFRTPVKDPAEIGFLLLLIASSIGAATGNFMATCLLFVAVFLVLGIRWMLWDRAAVGGRGTLMISLAQCDFAEVEGRINELIMSRLRNPELESMSMADGRVNLHYQYSRPASFDWTAFSIELSSTVAPAPVDLFVG